MKRANEYAITAAVARRTETLATTPYSCQLVGQPRLSKRCASIAVDFVDPIGILIKHPFSTHLSS
jgi:hypothetical protein